MGTDGIPAELLTPGGDKAVHVITALCNSVWKSNIWLQDGKISFFLPR